MGRDAAAAQLYYDKVSPCGGYLRQYTQQLLNKAITDGQGDYTTVSALSDRVKWAQTIVVALCLALGSLTAAAWAHGVGSCIMGAIDRPALTKLLGLPEGLRLCYMVALGYPTHESHLVEIQDGSVKYYLDENRNYCVPKRGMEEVLIKTL